MIIEEEGTQLSRVKSAPNPEPDVPLVAAIGIENVTPEIDGGRYAVKTTPGEQIRVEADIFKEGHDILGACVKFRRSTDDRWTEVPMKLLVNDRWQASFAAEDNTLYYYTIEAWLDAVASWKRVTEKKANSYSSVPTEVQEGISLLEPVCGTLSKKDQAALTRFLELLKASEGISEEVLQILSDPDLENIWACSPVKRLVTRYDKELPLWVDRPRARFGAWYELFPRSQGTDPARSGTFADCIRRLPDIQKMGFDVIYLPPIHPIGKSHRKGPNNSLKAPPGSPGCPWAIGSEEGGHKSIHPELGTLKDFRAFIEEADRHGIEIALDLAYQCSPDHPYVKEHPDWFYRLPDGTIRYAENPPKKYEDIYPINFHCDDQANLWEELKSVVLFWIDAGVKIFRVDNPHTKPLSFWKWLIEEIRAEHPDILFLAEAFTRPKVMKFLAKVGFTQSYTYFTWRNARWELREYLEELTQTEMKSYFRGNFFANTPDILHAYLQHGGRPAFKIRLLLAATLSSTYGIYSGYEFCENTPKEPGSEEYLDSEKYQIRVRDLDQPGNIKDYIARVNRIRADHLALQEYLNLEFYDSKNDNILCYGKRTADNSEIIVAVVNLDPHHVQEDLISLPIWKFGIEDWETYQMKDLITGEKYYWKGQHNYVRLDPNYEPAHLFRLRK